MSSKWKPTLIVLAVLAMLLAACAAPTAAPTLAPTDAPTKASMLTEAVQSTATVSVAAPPAAAISFANDIMPILQSRCFNCHGGESTREGLSLASYDTLMAGSQNGPVLVAGDAANSLLAQLIQNGKMPKRGPKLTPAEVQLIIDWINTGALNN